MTVLKRCATRYLENRDLFDVRRADGQQSDFELPSILLERFSSPLKFDKVTGSTYAEVVLIEAAS